VVSSEYVRVISVYFCEPMSLLHTFSFYFILILKLIRIHKRRPDWPERERKRGGGREGGKGGGGSEREMEREREKQTNKHTHTHHRNVREIHSRSRVWQIKYTKLYQKKQRKRKISMVMWEESDA
jgi:hypothetical protein